MHHYLWCLTTEYWKQLSTNAQTWLKSLWTLKWKDSESVSQSVVSSSLWDPTDCSPPGSSVHGKKTRVVCHALLQGIFPTQGLNLCLVCLLHWEEALWVVCKFWKLILCWSHQQICKYFLPNCEMSFCFVYFASFAVQELLRVSRSHLFIFVFTSIILGDR